MNNQKGQTGILVLAGIVILIAVAGGIFFLGRVTVPKTQTPSTTSSSQPFPTPQPTPTSDEIVTWKTYTNTKVGFQVKYPKNFSNPTVPSGVGPDVSYANESIDETEIIFDIYGLTIFPFKGTLNDLLSERKIRYADPKLQIPIIFPNIPKTVVKEIMVAGISAQWYQNGFEDSSYSAQSQEVHFIKGDRGFIFRVDYSGKNFNESEFNQILSTFRFLP